MRRAILILLFAIPATGVAAQGVSRVKQELARADFVSGARIEVREESDAADAVRNADRNPERTTMTAYGVRLFSDNSQSAGENARAAAARFAEMYPHIGVVVSYESPYFRVTAGSFVDRTDAVVLCGRVLADFPKAFIAEREVEIAEIVAGAAREAEPAEHSAERAEE